MPWTWFQRIREFFQGKCPWSNEDDPGQRYAVPNEAFDPSEATPPAVPSCPVRNASITSPADGEYIDMVNGYIDAPHSQNTYPIYSMSGPECERQLKQSPLQKGKFMIRHSHRQPGSHVLCVYNGADRVDEYIIRERDGQFHLGIEPSVNFKSLSDLVKHYTVNKSRLYVKLTAPAPLQRNTVTIPESLTNYEIESKRLVQKEQIGKGHFGFVYKGNLLPGRDVAIKRPREGGSNGEHFINEVKTMITLKHENIVELYGVAKDGGSILIVTEYIPLGSLKDYWKTTKVKFSFDDQINVIKQVAKGMAHMEENMYIHCDLRAANVLKAGNDIYKIADFGLSKYIPLGEYNADTFHAPLRWTSPEALQFKTFTHKSDVWSYGTFVYEVATNGEVPYQEVPEKNVEQHIINGGKLVHNPENNELFKITEKCMKLVAVERPTFRILKDILCDELGFQPGSDIELYFPLES